MNSYWRTGFCEKTAQLSRARWSVLPAKPGFDEVRSMHVMWLTCAACNQICHSACGDPMHYESLSVVASQNLMSPNHIGHTSASAIYALPR